MEDMQTAQKNISEKKNKAKAKIENIYALSFIQEALLFHSQQAKEDQGLIQVRGHLKGKLDLQKFELAWNQVVKRQESLRSSLHWENIKRPIQLVSPEASISLEFEDWSDRDLHNRQQQLEAFLSENRRKPFNFQKAPISRLQLIQLAENHFFLLWSCHHILLDGWSSALILREVFAYYQKSLDAAFDLNLPSLPKYRHYLNWQQQQDLKKAETFWKEQMAGFSQPSLLVRGPAADRSSKASFSKESFTLKTTQTESLSQYARQKRVTLNTLVQGAWAFLLSKLLKQSDIVFGVSVSGRSSSMPGIDHLCGMLMNVLPLRFPLEKEFKIGESLEKVQHSQARMLEYEYLGQDQIQSWIDWPAYKPLFDCLFVFENFPSQGLEGGGIKMEKLESDITSTYPLTCVVKPGQVLEIIIKTDNRVFDAETLHWLLQNFQHLLINIPLVEGDSFLAWDNLIDTAPPGFDQGPVHQDEDHPQDYQPPRNEWELKLTRIWENLFDRRPIGVHDHFFEMGGRSLLAVRLFAQIKTQLGRNLPPTMLLEHPTIAQLAGKLQENQEEKPWSALVPLNANGQGVPLFCLHGGGNHVFFYRELARQLGADQAVYALQSIGLDGLQDRHKSIEEMASHYLEEIQAIYPDGPYAILGYCFSNAIGLEMSRRLRAAGKEVALLAIIDSSPSYHPLMAQKKTQKDRWGQVFYLIGKGNWIKIYRKIDWKLFRPIREGWKSRWAPDQYRKTRQMIKPISDDIARAYQWKTYSGKIHLIQSEEVVQKPISERTRKAWKALAEGGLDIQVIPGKHHTLFEQPDVLGLAEKLKEILSENNKPARGQ